MSDETGPVRHVHGTWLIDTQGNPTVIVINDHWTETRNVMLSLPPDCDVSSWSWLCKDAVRINEPPRILCSETGVNLLNAELAPMSLNVWQPNMSAGCYG